MHGQFFAAVAAFVVSMALPHSSGASGKPSLGDRFRARVEFQSLLKDPKMRATYSREQAQREIPVHALRRWTAVGATEMTAGGASAAAFLHMASRVAQAGSPTALLFGITGCAALFFATGGVQQVVSEGRALSQALKQSRVDTVKAAKVANQLTPKQVQIFEKAGYLGKKP